jgi:Fe-S-cluster containining protein
MSTRKFTGKIRQDPWESLARGPREVMASIWQEYLEEVLEAPLKSERGKILRRQVEEAAGYPEIFQEWNTLSLEDRAAAWRRLVISARERLEAAREECVRCGECCTISSPTLLLEDLPLLHQGIITQHELYTLRPGEQMTSREGRPAALTEERLQIRKVPGTQQCWFFVAATRSCRIYDQRPGQCVRHRCWGEPPPPPAPEELLTRRHLFGQMPEIWELITAHEERCSLAQVRQALEEAAQGREEAGETLFETLHFDHYLRQMLKQEWGMTAETTELILGRPLTRFLKDLGVKATLTPEGVFRLSPMCTT